MRHQKKEIMHNMTKMTEKNTRKENISVTSEEINGTCHSLNDAQLVICGDEKCKLIQNKEIKVVNFTANSAKENYPITVHTLPNISR
jgi:hypothetical protein